MPDSNILYKKLILCHLQNYNVISWWSYKLDLVSQLPNATASSWILYSQHLTEEYKWKNRAVNNNMCTSGCTLFASKANKVNVFWKISSGGSLKGWRVPRVKKKFQQTLILVFEVIVQPHKHTIGCCTITSKAKINVFWKIFFTPNPLHRLSTRKNYKLAWKSYYILK